MNAAIGSLPNLSPSIRNRARAHINDPGDWRCVGVSRQTAPSGMIVPSSPCKRTVTWFVAGFGPLCHVCYEALLAANWRKIEISSIHRLSDKEEDFFKG